MSYETEYLRSTCANRYLYSYDISIQTKAYAIVTKGDYFTLGNYDLDDSMFRVVDIPTGYTHSITNVGEEDMVVVMWANEAFNPDKPDTYY